MPEPPDDATFRITVGATSFECRDGRFTTAVNATDTAGGTVMPGDIARSPTDWAAPAEVTVGSDLLTSGQLIEAVPQSDGSVALSLRSAVMFSERLMPPMVSQNLTPQEIMYAAAREAGFGTADIKIDGLADLPVEPMWVLAPIEGIRVDGTVRVGVVEFMNAAAGQEMLRRFSPPLDPAFAEPLEMTSGFARVAVVASLPYDAELEGLALIDTAAAWLTTRLRYSWSHAPDGALHHYEREPTRVTVERHDGVGVLSVDGSRRWWRNTGVARGSGCVILAPSARWMAPGMPAAVDAGDRQALLALQRAATANDPVQRVAALWEAVEFYVGNRSPEAHFTADEIAATVARARTGFADPKAERVERVLKQFLNQFSIAARLEHVLLEEGVPVTPDDVALLKRLRVGRNRALHGASAAPAHDEIDRAVAFMSRAITTRWHRAARMDGHSARDPRS